MKKIIMALLVLVTAQQAWAQHGSTESLFGSKHTTKIGAYGAPAVKLTSIDNTFGVLTGGYGGVLLNNKIMLGAGAWSLVNRIDAPRPNVPNDNDMNLGLWYTGFVGEYIHRSDKLVHWSAGALIGGGGVYRDERDRFRGHDDDRSYDYSGFFVTEPFVQAEMNITSYLRLTLGGTYRLILGSGTPGISDSDLSGPSVMIGIKAGKF